MNFVAEKRSGVGAVLSKQELSTSFKFKVFGPTEHDLVRVEIWFQRDAVRAPWNCAEALTFTSAAYKAFIARFPGSEVEHILKTNSALGGV